ncbi:hypothetical protein X777_11942, partial [Ooceraea biroi]
RRHFYGAFAVAAQFARLASESSYRSSIREPAIRQPSELLLEMERPGYNGVQGISRHFVPFLISFKEKEEEEKKKREE